LNNLVAAYANFQTTIKEINTFWKIAIADISVNETMFLYQANSREYWKRQILINHGQDNMNPIQMYNNKTDKPTL